MTKAFKPQIIAPGSYPQMIQADHAAQMGRALRSAVMNVKANRAIEENSEPWREAVRAEAARLESLGDAPEPLRDAVREIRNMAETCGMMATGRIADGLTRYCESCDALRLAPDPAVVMLHVSAITRTARDGDMLAQMSLAVAHELAALTEKKLAEATLAAANRAKG